VDSGPTTNVLSGFARAYVFFSSPINRNLLQQIKGDQSVLSRVGALREVSRLAPEGFLLFGLVDLHFDIRFSFHVQAFDSMPWYPGTCCSFTAAHCDERVHQMQMNLEYLAIDTQVFPCGTGSGSIDICPYQDCCDVCSLFHRCIVMADLPELWTVAGGKWRLCMSNWPW